MLLTIAGWILAAVVLAFLMVWSSVLYQDEYHGSGVEFYVNKGLWIALLAYVLWLLGIIGGR